jgi:hypothetical protein
MPPRKLVRAFLALWWTLGAVLLYASIDTVIHAFPRGAGAIDPHAAIIGSVEAVAAALFLFPRTMRAGAYGLLVSIAAAFIIHALRGQLAAQLLIYAAAVLFVLVHGPVPSVPRGRDVAAGAGAP